MNWQKHKELLLKNSKFQQALKENELELAIAKKVIEARIKQGLSQKDLAERLDTKQSVISRLENAKSTPSLTFLKRLAKALDTSFEIKIKPNY